MTNLYLVRHGESAWNQLQLYTGQRDIPLSERGMLQAQRLAKYLLETPFVALYASSLLRAYETARVVAKTFF